MMLETGNINIKDLSIEAPQNPLRLPFDPAVDITEEDWERVEHNLHNANNRHELIPPLDAIKTLSPLRFNQIVDRLEYSKDNLWESLRSSLRHPGHSTYQLMKYCREGKTLFSERFENFCSNDYFMKGNKRLLKRYINRPRSPRSTNPNKFLRVLVNGRLAYPDVTFKPEAVKSLVDLGLKYVLEDARNQFGYLSSEFLADIRLSDEDAFRRIKIREEDWLGMKVDLDVFRIVTKGGEDLFPSIALEIAIVAAHSAKITPEGIEIIMRDPNPTVSLADNLQLPIRRNF